MLLSIFKISGHSMLPNLKPNNLVLVSSIPYLISKPKIGDLVLLKLNNKILIKRIIGFDEGRIIIKGDNNRDSLKIGPILKKEIIGKVILAI